jgi:hypothetical protein
VGSRAICLQITFSSAILSTKTTSTSKPSDFSSWLVTSVGERAGLWCHHSLNPGSFDACDAIELNHWRGHQIRSTQTHLIDQNAIKEGDKKRFWIS